MQKLSRILYSYVSIGNSMICNDIWHKNYELYFEIFCTFFCASEMWDNFEIYAKYHVQIMLLFVYTTTRKQFVIFTCMYFKLS